MKTRRTLLREIRSHLLHSSEGEDREMLQRVLSRIKRRMRAAEIRDRLAVTSGKLTRLAMLDRRGNRALLVAQLAALEERLGDGWDEHRISEIMENYEHNVEKLTAAFQ